MLDIEAVEKKWDAYEEEFDNTEYMDIEQHTSAAFLVPDLISEVKRLRNVLNSKSIPLDPCDRCGNDDKNPGLDVCGPCYHEQITGEH